MPRRYEVVITEEAYSDLRSIFTYIRRDSPRDAARQIERLLQAVNALEYLPHRFRVYQTNKTPDRVIHSRPVPPWIVYYRVVEAEGVVRILTIRHGARRQPRRFKP